MVNLNNKKLLLHICCAPDATVVFERLSSDYNITGFFYNPNIHPQAEYKLRENEFVRLAKQQGVASECGSYDWDRWFELVEGMETEPEGGKRCRICIQMRIEMAAQFAKQHDFNLFTTVLTVSPHKNAELINQLGAEIGKLYQVEFMPANFKKQDGFKRSLELTKQYQLYRQNYCGCIFSKR
jgi:epoxyqueuosine reductase